MLLPLHAMEEDRQYDDFVELHGDRLFGFAMLVTLGDAVQAGTLSAEALAEGARRTERLHHPVRAAAWLRAWVARAASRPNWGRAGPSETERRDALAAIGVDPPAYDALAAIDARARAAVAVTSVEHFPSADVVEIVGSEDRVRHARKDYLAAYLASAQARLTEPPGGELAARVSAISEPILARTSSAVVPTSRKPVMDKSEKPVLARSRR